MHYSALMDIQVIYEQIYPLKPSRSCQQQYIHFIKSKVGFSSDVDQTIVEAANLV